MKGVDSKTTLTTPVEADHLLGDYAYSHPSASETSVEAFADELDQTEAAGADRPATVFRFPYGDKGSDRAAAFQEVLTARGFRPPEPDRIDYDSWSEHAGDSDWFWTVDAEDYNVDTKAALGERVADAARLDSGSADIRLVHDGGNPPGLFEHYAELLLDRGVTVADPLDPGSADGPVE